MGGLFQLIGDQAPLLSLKPGSIAAYFLGIEADCGLAVIDPRQPDAVLGIIDHRNFPLISGSRGNGNFASCPCRNSASLQMVQLNLIVHLITKIFPSDPRASALLHRPPVRDSSGCSQGTVRNIGG